MHALKPETKDRRYELRLFDLLNGLMEEVAALHCLSTFAQTLVFVLLGENDLEGIAGALTGLFTGTGAVGHLESRHLLDLLKQNEKFVHRDCLHLSVFWNNRCMVNLDQCLVSMWPSEVNSVRAICGWNIPGNRGNKKQKIP